MSAMIEQQRFNMVEQQVRPWDVHDPRVLAALGRVHREQFVADADRALAFVDIGLPLAHGESMMRPLIEGRLLQALALQATDSVLEIGTGSGFVTACLASLAREVLSVEIHADLAERASARLQNAAVSNAQVRIADALVGFEPGRSFDAIAVTGAVYQEPEQFRRWLQPGGRLFLIRGESPVLEAVLITRRQPQQFDEQSLFETDLPYLIHATPPKHFVL
ncbi:MAG: protein-L-isoaspartate O-methyltransferase [Lysobacterales bacterium CG02_land_8_20_14_3_00_62_12]|nr:MAG: protein-L-isoaspartate O-methyltransferase [Xanthomonadales bacterium CG02_land_8_20_14_3_00_62_12]